MANTKASKLIRGGVNIGQAVFLEDQQPTDVSFKNRRYLQSGFIETDPLLFDNTFWTEITPLAGATQTSPFGANNINSIAFGAGLFVAVADGGVLATSPDGVTWTLRASSFGASNITRVIFANSKFVAGGVAKIATSSDGITWVQETHIFGASTITGLSFGAGLYVATSSGALLGTSPDGAAWTSRTHGLGTAAKGVTFGNSIFAIVGSAAPQCQTSTDGITWSDGKAISNPTDVYFGGGLFVTSIGGTNVLFETTDPTAAGNAWVGKANGLVGVATAAKFINGVWLAVSTDPTSLVTSTGGGIWLTDVTVGSNAKNALFSDGNVLVIGGDAGELVKHDLTLFAGSKVAHIEFGENQYVRII